MLLMISYPAALDGAVQKPRLREVLVNYRVVVGQFIHSFRNLSVLKAIVNTSSYSGYYKAVKDYLQPFIKAFALGLPILVGLEDKQRAALLIGILYFVLYFLTSFASRWSGRFTDRLGRITLAINLSLLAGVGVGLLSGLFYEAGIITLALLFYFLVFILENLRKPAGIAYVAEMLDQDILASALSAESQAETLFSALLALVLGFTAQWFGVGWGLVTTSAILLLLMPVLWARGRKKDEG